MVESAETADGDIGVEALRFGEASNYNDQMIANGGEVLLSVITGDYGVTVRLSPKQASNLAGTLLKEAMRASTLGKI